MRRDCAARSKNTKTRLTSAAEHGVLQTTTNFDFLKSHKHLSLLLLAFAAQSILTPERSGSIRDA